MKSASHISAVGRHRLTQRDEFPSLHPQQPADDLERVADLARPARSTCHATLWVPARGEPEGRSGVTGWCRSRMRMKVTPWRGSRSKAARRLWGSTPMLTSTRGRAATVHPTLAAGTYDFLDGHLLGGRRVRRSAKRRLLDVSAVPNGVLARRRGWVSIVPHRQVHSHQQTDASRGENSFHVTPPNGSIYFEGYPTPASVTVSA